ncbi:MAG: substrate-binding domain-containing protein [Pseudorhodobacter sp.]
MLERGIDALILLGENFSSEVWHLLDVQQVPFLIIYSYRSDTGRAYVGVDNTRAARLSAQYLLDLGHRDIVILSQDITNNDRVAARMYGFTEALRDRGVLLPPERVIYRSNSIASGFAVAIELIEAGTLPTGILCTNDNHAAGILSACQGRGIEVPGDLSVIGFDDLEIAAFSTPPMTTIKVPARDIGVVAARQIVAHLEQDQELDSVEFQVSLMKRRSTASVSK